MANGRERMHFIQCYIKLKAGFLRHGFNHKIKHLGPGTKRYQSLHADEMAFFSLELLGFGTEKNPRAFIQLAVK